jgi:hypothetical protein
MPFTPEDKATAFSNILEYITQGLSVKKSIKRLREEEKLTCCEDTFFVWLAGDKTMSEQYVCARENRADTRFEKLDEIVEDVKAGILETDKAKVVIDVMKWQMGKEKGSVYGVKADITSKGESLTPKDATSIILGKLSQEDLEAALSEAESE